jgi:hypothetical protein
VTIGGEMVTRVSFASRGSVRREWRRSGLTRTNHPSNGVLEPRVQMPRANASVRTVPAWGERKAAGGATGRTTPVRLVSHTGQTGAGLDRLNFGFRARTDSRFGSGVHGSGGWSGEFAGG